jgi:hydroxyacylglutathione hydrolase
MITKGDGGTMLSIQQIRYASDNLAYVIHGTREAMAVDGGAAREILTFLSSRGLSLRYVANTHGHADHTPGNALLLKSTGATLLKPLDAAAEGTLLLENERIQVHPAPGHTSDSVTFHLDDRVITGDTLFNGTVGNCFSGDMRAFYDTIKGLMALPDRTRVYAGHDYVTDSMAFARLLEPANPHIEPFLSKYNPKHVRSILADERRVNPYVRFNDPDIIRVLEKRGLPVATEYERWESIMSLG